MKSNPYVIMLVDDDADFLEVNRCILESNGYTVICCLDPQEALDRIAQEKPHLVVSDLMMGSLDSGFSLSRKIKADPRFCTIPVIIITAVSSQLGFDFHPRSPQELKEMGADGFLSKPVEPQEFLAKIEELLDIV
jgi:CheY-like chemotaxis protein